jgi:GntR family transcriptional regulator
MIPAHKTAQARPDRVIEPHRIESRIKSGELKPGARLPPEREMASDFGVAYDTVRRAAALLRERGLIITVHGRGTYVA